MQYQIGRADYIFDEYEIIEYKWNQIRNDSAY